MYKIETVMKKVTIKLDDGVYCGDFFDGVRQGYGVYEWSNGDRYEGNYRNNKKEGRNNNNSNASNHLFIVIFN